MNRLLPLGEAIRRHVTPGMHLHFASTPSRSNAAVREVARAFLDQRPDFVLSATGFHSSAHTLALLALGARYIGCFFGDNYPSPRPNALYQRLPASGATLEHWSLLTYVQALRAGALGHPYAVTTSLGGSDLGRELAKQGRLFEVPDPAGGAQPLRLLAPLVPDVAFLHAPVGSASGRALFSAPFGEGFHGALAARRGVIVTVEKIVSERELDGCVHVAPLPPSRVLAIAEEPFGAHPQPLHVTGPIPGVLGYDDDFAAYEAWRELALDPARFAAYRRKVLEATDGRRAYFEFAGHARLEALRVSEEDAQERRKTVHRSSRPSSIEARPALVRLGVNERMILLAARTIAERVVRAGHDTILAGIGQAFAASRVALALLDTRAADVELIVETGISGFDPRDAHPFLLSALNMAHARRLSSIDENLGALACGRGNRCLAVVGCAEADATGALNSSFVKGELVVGSGGASDLTAAAREVVVLCRSERLVPRVEFVTSPGDRVIALATEDAVLERCDAHAAWRLARVGLGGSASHDIALALPFPVELGHEEPEPMPTAVELAALANVLGTTHAQTQGRQAHA